MTRTAVGTDDFGDDAGDGSSDYGVRKYEEDRHDGLSSARRGRSLATPFR